MNIAIDIGNTYIKVGYFNKNNLVGKETYTNNDHAWLMKIEKNIEHCIVSASGKLNDSMIDSINQLFPSVHYFTRKSKIPIIIKYKTPDTLGLDRIAGAVGALTKFPNTNVLVIDAGTAITYDFISNNSFMGGNISPGLSLRYRSLNEYTARLPLGDVPDKFEIYGQSTIEAINFGVYNGLLYEIEGAISRFELQEGELSVVLTGGESQFFVNKIKRTIFAEPNLVLIGLNRILIQNV